MHILPAKDSIKESEVALHSMVAKTARFHCYVTHSCHIHSFQCPEQHCISLVHAKLLLPG